MDDDELNNHISTIHKQEKLGSDLNKCYNCGNEFNDKYNLMNHSRAFSLEMFSTGQMLRV